MRWLPYQVAIDCGPIVRQMGRDDKPCLLHLLADGAQGKIENYDRTRGIL